MWSSFTKKTLYDKKVTRHVFHIRSRSTFFTCTLLFKWSTTNKIQLSVFSSPDPKDQVSYCHHLASVVVVRRNLFQKSSPLKVLDQWKPNLVFELLPKTCNFTICSIFSNSSHVGWCTASSDTFLKLDTLVMIQTKFGFNWSSSFRGEDFWKSLRRTNFLSYISKAIRDKG
jgi:hypothetical protein